MKSHILIIALMIPFLTQAQAPIGVQGNIAAIKGQTLIVATPKGNVTVHLAAGLNVYGREASNLRSLQVDSYVGITSNNFSGKEWASEIHIFPIAMRGLGEGSRMMGTNNATVYPNRMTNGNVKYVGLSAPTQMMEGTNSVDRVGSVILTYRGGQMPIEIPANVTVTEVVPIVRGRFLVGMSVFAIGTQMKDGSWLARRVLIMDTTNVK